MSRTDVDYDAADEAPTAAAVLRSCSSRYTSTSTHGLSALASHRASHLFVIHTTLSARFSAARFSKLPLAIFPASPKTPKIIYHPGTAFGSQIKGTGYWFSDSQSELAYMSKVPIRIIAILEITGGFLGMAFVIWGMVTQMSNLLSLPIGMFEVLIDFFAVVAGIALWSETSFGRKASIAIQLIQTPKLTSPVIVFLFSFGFDLWVHASSSGDVGFQVSFFFNQFFLNLPNAPVDFGLSLTAVVALVILKKYQPPPRALGRLPPPPDLSMG